MRHMLFARNGAKIVTSLEELQAASEIEDVGEKGPNGEFDIAYSGTTDYHTDSQRTVRENGVRLFLDADGASWEESQLMRLEVDENGDRIGG